MQRTTQPPLSLQYLSSLSPVLTPSNYYIYRDTDTYHRPILNNSITPIKEFHLAKIIERVLKLSTVSLIAWLAGFFCIFHSTLNALAEIMHFADRNFYEAWWNSGSVGTYWRLWNIPVHSYFKRHIYVPLRRRGWSNTAASIMVFFISAVIHEILLGVPTHAVYPHEMS